MYVHACLRMMRISRWKLNVIAAPIRRKRVSEALSILEGMRRRGAIEVRKTLLSAVANAENNFGLDADNLRVCEATVGRSLILKRSDIRGRSRVGRIEKEFSQLRVVLREE